MKIKNRFLTIFLCSFLIFVLCGCSFLEENKKDIKKEIIKDNEGKEFIEPYVDENPIELSLYINQNGTRTLTTTIDSPMTIYQDIVSLEVYYTNEESLIGNQKKIWNQYYSKYQDIDSYKIGYQVSFQAEGQNFQQLILKPSDANHIFSYIQIYLYDDIHQESNWYDHIKDEDITEDTLLTSIKLTASTKIDTITSPITVTAFTYDEDDFDEEGNYRGKSSYEIIIQKNKF